MAEKKEEISNEIEVSTNENNENNENNEKNKEIKKTKEVKVKKTKKSKEENTSEIENKSFKQMWEKVVLALKKYSIIPYTVIGIALFFLSMMLAAQMKSMSDTEELIAGKRETQLADELVTLQRKYDDLKSKYDDSAKIVEEYQNNSSTNNTLIASMKDQIQALSAMSGVTDLKGEGIVISLNDGTKTSDTSVRSDTLVHDSDLLTVVNELKAAGAEAISINGQRIIATSAIRCVGPVIQVNYQKVAAPFEIKAIGNAQYLESAMTIKNGVVDLLKEYGVSVTVSRQNNVEIPKYEGEQNFKNASVKEK